MNGALPEPVPERPRDDGGEPPGPASVACALCETLVPAGLDRCPSCGLWRGTHRDPIGRSVLLRVVAAFMGLYAVALLVVALAR